MSADDTAASPENARPPHPATVPHERAVQPKAGEGRPPHPATAQRKAAEPAKSRKARGPHPATVKRGAAQPKKAGAGKPPHPATVKRGAAQPKRAGGDKPPHPATKSRSTRSAGAQPTNKKKVVKGGKERGIVAYLNGDPKPIAATTRDQPSGHVERRALAKAPAGDITLEQNAWPCAACHTWLARQSRERRITITVSVTDDQGSFSLEHAGEGVKPGNTGTLVYTKGVARITVAGA